MAKSDLGLERLISSSDSGCYTSEADSDQDFIKPVYKKHHESALIKAKHFFLSLSKKKIFGDRRNIFKGRFREVKYCTLNNSDIEVDVNSTSTEKVMKLFEKSDKLGGHVENDPIIANPSTDCIVPTKFSTGETKTKVTSIKKGLVTSIKKDKLQNCNTSSESVQEIGEESVMQAFNKVDWCSTLDDKKLDTKLPLKLANDDFVRTKRPTDIREKLRIASKKRNSAGTSKGIGKHRRDCINQKLSKNIHSRRRKTFFPNAVGKVKHGFIIAKNHLNKNFSTKFGACSPGKPYICRHSYRKSKSLSKIGIEKSKLNDVIESDNVGCEAPSVIGVAAQCGDIARANNAMNVDKELLLAKSNLADNQILNYSFIALDNFFSNLEHLHDHMDLVRNGIQQLIDNFTHPRAMSLQHQESILLQFKHSIQILQFSIETLHYSVYNLPTIITNQRYLLLPCRNTIEEFDGHVQLLSVDFEHAQYFNNESPMLTMLKMVVVINTLYCVMTRGRRAFHRTIEYTTVNLVDTIVAFDLKDQHERYIRPTFDLLFSRTEAMVELGNLSRTLEQSWQETRNWDSFLPDLQQFMKNIGALEQYFFVPDNDWYVVRIIPETRLMHVFDGFMSEFYRAIVSPDFARDNPVAFGAIFTVLKYILDNIISQHVVILRDLRRSFKSERNDGGNCSREHSNVNEQVPEATADSKDTHRGGATYTNV